MSIENNFEPNSDRILYASLSPDGENLVTGTD